MNTFFYIACIFTCFIVFCFLLFLTFYLIKEIVEDGIDFDIKNVFLLFHSIAILLLMYYYISTNLEF